MQKYLPHRMAETDYSPNWGCTKIGLTPIVEPGDLAQGSLYHLGTSYPGLVSSPANETPGSDASRLDEEKSVALQGNHQRSTSPTYVLAAERVGHRNVPTWFTLCLSAATSGAVGRALLGQGVCPQLAAVGLSIPHSQSVTNLKRQISCLVMEPHNCGG